MRPKQICDCSQMRYSPSNNHNKRENDLIKTNNLALFLTQNYTGTARFVKQLRRQKSPMRHRTYQDIFYHQRISLASCYMHVGWLLYKAYLMALLISRHICVLLHICLNYTYFMFVYNNRKITG